MCDTNWCTFCDCAVSPFSNSIYCSEDCFRRDALPHDPLYKIYIEQQKQQQEQQCYLSPKITIKSDIHMNYTPEYTQQTRRESNSSICSEDLAAMHMDMIPCSPPFKTAPQLSTSISLASNHSDTILRTPPSYNDVPIYEKIIESDVPFNNTAPQFKLQL
ncbi:hypothetical protein MAM1_0089d04853 [Mucor ambiguus]|uniref:Uncharacterized protein n=1 Tax=Mucor ambiguus TaxID=91626 RepID=A0A0C9MTI7_9FUNG|nr:hypothetical protein MAM1_0089d04853 [Mucor ambiguus]